MSGERAREEGNRTLLWNYGRTEPGLNSVNLAQPERSEREEDT